MPNTTEPIQPIPVTNEEFASQNEEYGGICIGCRKWTGDQCEPDAHERPCPECHLQLVYGAEEALLQGFITITD